MQFQEEEVYTKRFDVGPWKKLFRLSKPYYRYMLGILIVAGLTAGLEVIFPLLKKDAIDNFAMTGSLAGLTPFIIKYAVCVVAFSFSIFVFIRLCGTVEVGLCRHIRRTAFKRLQELPFSFYDKTSVGYLIARLTSDTQRLGDTVAWGLLDIMWSLFFLLIVSITMFILNWRLTLITLSVVPVMAVITGFFQVRILKSYREVRRINSRITGAFNEGIMGAKTTKTLVREDANFEEFQVLTSDMRRSSIRAAVLSAGLYPLIIGLGGFATAFLLWKGGHDVFITGSISIGTLTAFISYATQIFEPISNIARVFAEAQQSQAAAERVISLIETETEIADTPEVVAEFGDNFNPKRENWPKLTGNITFKDVSFQYIDGETVLKNFNLDVKAGETIALVGETGSGKSTIVNLLCRFYEPTKGEILIDGVNYKKRSQLWLQSNLGYVLQQPHLFSGTIRDNIRYGKLDATDEEVEQAARMVSADQFIATLDKGYDTSVGEGGNLLSTGQKQLISFARALIGKPAIFVLDEATSSVDTETEMKIQHAIQTALTGRTSFIIAHRLSTIRGADRILVIQNGEITEAGSHKELLKLKGYYHDLYINQFRDEREQSLLAEIK
jgi:ATP-binding cassette, subfamily B, bacterial